MNEKDLMSYIDLVADRTADRVLKALGKEHLEEKPAEWVEAKEGARIIGVNPNYLRSIKSKFTFRKVGGSERGRLLFNRQELMDYYLNNHG